MRRRHFLTFSATAVGGMLVHAQDDRKIRVPLRFFDEREALIIAAATARIFPSDANGPGAKEAGVVIISTANWLGLTDEIATVIRSRLLRTDCRSKGIRARPHREKFIAKGWSCWGGILMG